MSPRSLLTVLTIGMIALSDAALFAPAARAAILVNSETNGGGSTFRRTDSGSSPIGQQFTLSTDATITSIEGFIGFTSGTVTLGGMSMEIRSNGPSNTIGSLVVGGTSATPTGTLSTTGFTAIKFAFPTAPTLAAGTYWIQLTSNQGTNNLVRWLQQDSTTATNLGSFGTMNNTVFYLGAYHDSGNGGNQAFYGLIEGTPVTASVPEPSSCAMAAVIGVAGLSWNLLRRRQRAA